MSFLPTSIPTKRLASSITSTDMSFQLDDIIGWDGVALTAADFGTQAYCVFRNSNRTQLEIMEFNPATIASTSITISKRGLDFTGDPTTEITANKLDWTSGDTFVDLGTDTPQLWQWLKDYIDGVAIAGVPHASTTIEGNVEEATAAEVLAETAVGSTGARLFVNPSTMYRTVTTMFPKPISGYTTTAISAGSPTSTTAWLGLVDIPYRIVANKLSFYAGTVTVAGTFDISLYTEDGQTQVFSVTTASVNANSINSVSLPTVTITPGQYYICVNGNSTTNIQLAWYLANATGLSGTSNSLLGDVASEPLTRGQLTITTDTPPTTFTPTSLTDSESCTLVVRLDN